jgi:hypothetical protein
VSCATAIGSTALWASVDLFKRSDDTWLFVEPDATYPTVRRHSEHRQPSVPCLTSAALVATIYLSIDLTRRNKCSLAEPDGLIWNRVCDPAFSPRLRGDRALFDVIRFDAEINSSGIDFAIDGDGYGVAGAAAAGLRLFGAAKLAEFWTGSESLLPELWTPRAQSTSLTSQPKRVRLAALGEIWRASQRGGVEAHLRCLPLSPPGRIRVFR